MSLFGPSFMHANMGSRRGLMAPAPIIQMGSGVLVSQLLITHAMQISGGNFTIVPAMAGIWFWPVLWQIQKPGTWSAGYAPTNTTFNLRAGSLVTNLATGLTPTVTNTNARIDAGIASTGLNIGGTTPYSQLVNQPLVVNCGAGNAGGNAANAAMLATVYYVRIKAQFLTP